MNIEFFNRFSPRVPNTGTLGSFPEWQVNSIVWSPHHLSQQKPPVHCSYTFLLINASYHMQRSLQAQFFAHKNHKKFVCDIYMQEKEFRSSPILLNDCLNCCCKARFTYSLLTEQNPCLDTC